VRYDGFACRGIEVSPDSALVTALAESYRTVEDAAPGLVPTTATTDARLFVQEGIPAVCFGPWAENLHAADERVNIPSMVTAAQVLAVFVRDWCGVST
jgi:acetylornithine deacetylase